MKRIKKEEEKEMHNAETQRYAEARRVIFQIISSLRPSAVLCASAINSSFFASFVVKK